MAETLGQRLQRIAAEKKAEAARKAELVELVTENTEANLDARLEAVKANHSQVSENVHTDAATSGESADTKTDSAGIEASSATLPATKEESGQVEEQVNRSVESYSAVVHNNDPAVGPEFQSDSKHPLVMEFAELQQALDSKDPEFKHILRKIHQQLGKDPDLVTQMSELEIQQVVTGMIVFANAEIVAPAKEKSAKAAVTAAKKKVISVDDL